MSPIPQLIIALAIATVIFMIGLAVAVGLILLVSKNPLSFAEIVPHIIDRLTQHG